MQVVTVKKSETLHRKPKNAARQPTRIDMRTTSKISLAKIGEKP